MGVLLDPQTHQEIIEYFYSTESIAVHWDISFIQVNLMRDPCPIHPTHILQQASNLSKKLT